MSDTHRDRRSDAPAHRLRPLPALIRHGLLASAGALLAQGALLDAASAAPQGGNVVAGQGQISAPDEATTLVHQQSHSMVVNWQSFDVAKPETVQFNQPSSSAAVLNRVLNQSASQIHGAVRANGQVFILNGSGVVFGKDARVDVGGLVVSSLDITNSDFMAGRYSFKAADGQTPGAIVNRGLIQAARGGSVTLVGGQVANEGVIVADAGHVNLAAGRTATLDFDGDGLVRFEVDGALLENATGVDAAVSNSGEIRAEGGQVLLSARAASQVFDRAVNNSGLIRAGGIHKAGGKVMLTGFGGGVRNTGTIDASGSSGGEVRMVSDAVVEQFGAVRADGSEGNGGLVHLASLDTTLVGGDSVTSARSDAGKGGTVRVLGDKVGVYDRATVDASGATGGGRVLVGGDLEGGNPAIRNASATFVGSTATVRADATDSGNGGTVVVWADGVTRAHGTLTARGGAQGGDGGLIETSGKVHLNVSQVRIDASAPSGQGGMWLLDPFNITINDGGPTTAVVSPLPDFAADQDGSVIDAADIEAQLDAGTSVTITTSDGLGGGIQAGDILVGGNIEKTAGGDATLTLTAAGTITVNNIISSTTGALGVSLHANDNTDGPGGQNDQNTAVGDVQINAAITTNGGDFNTSGVAFDNTGGTITTDGGAVNIDQTGAVTLGAAISVGAATATIATSAGAINGGGLVTAATVDLNAASGIGNTTPLSLAATTITADTTTGAIDVNSALATAVAANSLTTVGAGSNVTFDQTGGGAVTFGTVSGETISLSNTGANLTVGTSVTAAGANNVTLTTTTSGDVVLAGTTTADGDQVTVTSAGNINGGGLVTAATVDLNAASGIGNTTPLELAASMLTADTAAGAIDIDNDLATAVAIDSLTTTGAAITFEQTNDGVATFGTVTTSGANPVSLAAQVGLTLTGTLTTGGGAVSLNADSDNVDSIGVDADTGTLTLGGSSTINTGGAMLSLTAFTFGTTGTLNLGGGALAVNFTRNTDLTLGDQSTVTPTLSDAAMDTFTTAGGGVLALSTGGSIVLDRTTAANGDLTLSAGTTITDNNTGLAWQNATGTLTLTAGGNIGDGGDNTLQVDLAGLTVTAGGTLNVTNGDGAGGDTSAASTTYQLGTNTALGAVTVSQGGGALVVGAGGIDSTGDIALMSVGNVSQSGAITGAALEVTTTTGAITLANAGNDVNTVELDATGAISFTDSDDLTVGAGEVSGSQVTLNAGGPLTLSGDVEGAGGVTLVSGGDLVATANIDGGTSAVVLNSGGTISQTGIIIGGPLSTTSTGGTTLGSANTVSAFAAANAGGGNVMLNNSGALALAAVNTGGGDLNVTNAGNVSVTGASTTGGGALTLTTSAGAINGAGGSLNAGAGTLTLSSATGIGTGGAIVSAGTGNVNLTTAGAGAAGNITLTDTSAGAFATSLLTTLATMGSSQTITLTDAVGFNFDSNAAVAGLSADTLNFNGATTLNANLVVPAGSFVNINGATTVGAGGANPTGAGSVTFNGAVASAQAFTVATAVANFSSDITMAGGAALNLNSADTNFTDDSNVITDVLNLGGGAGSVDGPGTLTILRASASAADTTIGGTDPLFSATNLAALGGFNGTLNIGGTRDAPPTAAQLLNDINVTGNLATAGNIFMVGGGDITFDNTVPGQGRFETSSPTGVITVAALGTAGTEESGNIRDTADFVSVGTPGRVAIVANTAELLAANQIGQEGGTGGGRLNIRVAVESLAQGVEGDALVDNGILSAASSGSISEVLDTFAAAAAPGGALAGRVSFSTVNLTVSSVQLLATPKQAKGELGFIDEGVFLLPSAFTSPERALLMPLLGDADFPGDQRPQDPNDDAAWLAFFEDVLRPYIASRYSLGENATAQERAAVEALIARELETVIAYYEAVRERERTQLALEQAAREAAPPVPVEPGQNPAQEQVPAVPPLQQGAARPELEFGYVGQPWSGGGIGVEPRGWTPRGGVWPVRIAPTSG